MNLTSKITVRLIQSMGGDNMVVAAAKVSTSGEEAITFVDKEANFGLINYLMKQKHGSPFESSGITFFVHAPIFVWREWHRHRIGFAYIDYEDNYGTLGMSFNEESARYKKLEPTFYIPSRDRPMMKVEDWRPGRPKFTRCESDELYRTLINRLVRNYRQCYEDYEANLADGFDPGLARDCLPVGIYSSCWVTCNPRSLMSFLSLRTSDAGKSYPLYEIEVAAHACEECLAVGWPLTYKAFQENGRVAP